MGAGDSVAGNMDEFHIHVAGAVGASLVPWWIHSLREAHPGIHINASLSRGASRFVALGAVRHLVNGSVWTDDWEDSKVPVSVTAGASGESKGFLVFPATLDFLMRLAQGRSDTPALLMLQVTELPIVIADSLPVTNAVIHRHLEVLRLRENLAYAPRVYGVRARDRSRAESGLNFPGAFELLSQICNDL